MGNPLKILDAVAFTMVAGGALYLGILGLFGVDLVALIFGAMSFLSRLIYTVIGLAAVYQLSQFRFVHQRWARGAVNASAISANDKEE